MLRKAVLALSLIQVVGLTGCLEMRDDKKEVDEKVVMRRQVQTLQQSTADVNSRFNEVEDDTRKIHGQLAEDDQKIKQTNALMDKGFGMADTKFKERDQVYREEFTKAPRRPRCFESSVRSPSDSAATGRSCRAPGSS